MTEIERAIALMESIIGSMYGDDILPENKETAAQVAELVKTTIIPVLREQAEREKGCEACRSGKLTLEYMIKMLKYSFCPICGRELTGGAEHE